jgi:hypothetical protein
MGENDNYSVYKLDLVFCIDTCQYMHDVLEDIKNKVIRFVFGIKKWHKEKCHVNYNQIRVRLITFPDLIGEKKKQSSFYCLEKEREQLLEEINQIRLKKIKTYNHEAYALKALIEACQSNWEADSFRYRRFIICWTKAGLKSKLSLSKQFYEFVDESEMNTHEIFRDLTDCWTNIRPSHSRAMMLYVPEAFPWKEISEYYDNTGVSFMADARFNWSDLELQDIMYVAFSSL